MEAELAAIYGSSALEGEQPLLQAGAPAPVPAAAAAGHPTDLLAEAPAGLASPTAAAAAAVGAGEALLAYESSAAAEPAPAAAAATAAVPAKPMVRAAQLLPQAAQPQAAQPQAAQPQAAQPQVVLDPTALRGGLPLSSQLLAASQQHLHPQHQAPLDQGGPVLPAYAVDDGAPGAGAAGGAAGRGGKPAGFPPGFAPVEVFIGGLPPDADDFEAFLALANAGEVLSVKLFRRGGTKGDCRGYGLVMMASQQDAEAAAAEVTEACGARVAVSIPTGADVAQLDAAVRKGPVQLRRRGQPRSPAAAGQAATAAVKAEDGALGKPEAEQGVAADGEVGAEVKGEPREEVPGSEDFKQEPQQPGEGEQAAADAQLQQQQQPGEGEEGELGAEGPGSGPAGGGGEVVGAVAPPAPPEGSMARLLRRVREFGEGREEAAAAAYTTLFAVHGRPKLAFPPSRPYRPPVPAGAAAAAPAAEPPPAAAAPRPHQPGQQPAAAVYAAQRAAAAAARASAQQAQQPPPGAAALPALGSAAPLLPDFGSYLDGFPRCKELIEKFRAAAGKGAAPKTPLQAVHEYASRLMLEVLYDERAENAQGPFLVEAKLTGQRGQQTFATGSGRAASKQLAKQMAGAALLESLLTTVPESDFLVPGRSKESKAQYVNPRSGLGVARGRGGRGVRGGAGRAVPSFVSGGRMQPQHDGAGFDLQPAAQAAAEQAGAGYPGQYGQPSQQGPRFGDPAAAGRQQQGPYGATSYPAPAPGPAQQQQYYAGGQYGSGAAASGQYSSGGAGGQYGSGAAAAPRAGGYGASASDTRDPRLAARGGGGAAGYGSGYGGAAAGSAPAQQAQQVQQVQHAQQGQQGPPWAAQAGGQGAYSAYPAPNQAGGAGYGGSSGATQAGTYSVAQQPQQATQLPLPQEPQGTGAYASVYGSGSTAYPGASSYPAAKPQPAQQAGQQPGAAAAAPAPAADAAAVAARRYISNTSSGGATAAPAAAPAGYGGSAPATAAAAGSTAQGQGQYSGTSTAPYPGVVPPSDPRVPTGSASGAAPASSYPSYHQHPGYSAGGYGAPPGPSAYHPGYPSSGGHWGGSGAGYGAAPGGGGYGAGADPGGATAYNPADPTGYYSSAGQWGASGAAAAAGYPQPPHSAAPQQPYAAPPVTSAPPAQYGGGAPGAYGSYYPGY